MADVARHAEEPPSRDRPRRAGECECGHVEEIHQHYTTSEHCGACTCGSYHRTFWHWFVDQLGD